jgi:hypothetical protein
MARTWLGSSRPSRMAKRLAPSTLATRVRSFASASAVVRRPVGETGASASPWRLALSAKARSNSARRASAASPGGTAEPLSTPAERPEQASLSFRHHSLIPARPDATGQLDPAAGGVVQVPAVSGDTARPPDTPDGGRHEDRLRSRSGAGPSAAPLPDLSSHNPVRCRRGDAR